MLQLLPGTIRKLMNGFALARFAGLAMIALTVITSSQATAKGISFSTEPKVYVRVDGAGIMKISWYVPKLDQAHAGFTLSRAEVKKEVAEKDWVWSSLGEELMRPDFRLERLKKLKLDSVIEQRPKMKKAFVDASPKQAIAMILEQPAEEFQKLQLVGGLNIEIGIALGSAWIDHDVELGKTYAYRVHTRVYGKDGKITAGELIGQEQLIYEVNAIKMPELETFELERTKIPKSVRVLWSIKAEALEGREDLRSFKIIAGDLDDPLGTTSIPVRFGKKSEDGKLIQFNASMSVKTNDAMSFVIQPRGREGTTGPPSQPIVLQELGGPLGDVENLTTKIEDGDVVLAWDYDAKKVGEFSGFQISRKVLKAGDTQWENIVPDLLPSEERGYTDKDAATKFAGERVMYIVRAMSPDSRRDSGAGQETIQLP